MTRRGAEDTSSRLDGSQQEGSTQGSQTPSLSGQTLIAKNSHVGSNEQPLHHDTASSSSRCPFVSPSHTSSSHGQYLSQGTLRWLNQTSQEEPWNAVARIRNVDHKSEAAESGKEKSPSEDKSKNGTNGK